MHYICGPHGSVVFFLHGHGKRKRFCVVGVCAVQDDYEGFSLLFQFTDNPFLCLHVILAANLGDAAVRRQNNTDGRMLRDDLSRADFRSFFKGDVMIMPRRAHHARHVVFNVSNRTRNHITNAIYHADSDRCRVADFQLRSFVRDELWLRCHDGPSCSALRQLICQAFLRMRILHPRQYEEIHETFDKGRFSRPDGADHTNIDISIRSFRDIAV